MSTGFPSSRTPLPMQVVGQVASQNVHPRQTRAKFVICKHKILVATATKELVSVEVGLQHESWKVAMIGEILMRNRTWSLVPLPLGRRAIACKWVGF